MTPEIAYLILIFILFVLPPAMTRLRVPAGISAFALGMLSLLAPSWFETDHTLHLLASFGVIALFLLAGLEIDLAALKAGLRLLVLHVGVRLLAFWALASALEAAFALPAAAAWIMALALATPSTGFILESMERLPLNPEEKSWVKSIAIAVEMAALVALFVALRSGTVSDFALSSAAFGLMILAVPLFFKFFAKVIAPYAPHSEFAFMIMLALLCGFVAKKLGTYYLVGAFVVGLAARRFREVLPAITSESMFYAVRLFAFFFMPFYFFDAGRSLKPSDLSLGGLGLGLLFFAVLAPLRATLTWLELKFVLSKGFTGHGNVALCLLPNLVFGVVLTQILMERFQIAPFLAVGLLTYTVLVSALPAFWVKRSELGDPSATLMSAFSEGRMDAFKKDASGPSNRS